MKNYFFYRIGLLCLFVNISMLSFGQEYISLPIEGSVFQQDNNGNATVYFTVNESASYSDSKVYYRVINMTTTPNTPIVNLKSFTKTFSDANNINSGGLKGFYTVETLPKGWYRLEYIHKWKFLGLFDCIDVCDKIEFGVGDVYFVAGQSNASGFNPTDGDLGLVTNSTDNNGNQADNKWTRTLSYSGNRWGPNVNNQTKLELGIPYSKSSNASKFNELKKEVNTAIYPNGYSSWSWAPLGNKFANETAYKTPTLFFNSGQPNTTLVYDWIISTDNATKHDKNSPTTLIGKFYQTLGIYGNIFGAKAVLWHQGERDARIMNGIEPAFQTYVTNNYSPFLEELISSSRTNITGLKDLSWFVSKVSYNTSGRASDVALACPDSDPNTTFTKNTNSTLLNYQSSVPLSKVFAGVSTDDISECDRAAYQRIHFSGAVAGNNSNSLGTLATRWYDKINANYANAISVSATKVLMLNKVEKTQNANTYKLTVETPPNSAITYYWVKNEKGINFPEATTTINVSPLLSASNGDRLMCFVKDNPLTPVCNW
jgi:hypothetical protein